MFVLSESLLQENTTLRGAWLKLRCTVSLSISGPPSLGEEGIQHRYVQVAVICESVELKDVRSWRVRFHIVLVVSVTSSACKPRKLEQINGGTRDGRCLVKDMGDKEV